MTWHLLFSPAYQSKGKGFPAQMISCSYTYSISKVIFSSRFQAIKILNKSFYIRLSSFCYDFTMFRGEMDLFVEALFIQKFLFLLPSFLSGTCDDVELNFIPFNQSIKLINSDIKKRFLSLHMEKNHERPILVIF